MRTKCFTVAVADFHSSAVNTFQRVSIEEDNEIKEKKKKTKENVNFGRYVRFVEEVFKRYSNLFF